MSANGNKNKDQLLGISHGTAMHRLRKAIMFDMAKQLGKDICHQCSKRIETIEEFSIEHIQAWQRSNNPSEAFFDLKNISFSHLSCNIGAGLKVNKPKPNYHLGRETVAKLNKEQVAAIKRLLNAGELSQRKIANIYNVHHSSIQAIADGRSWVDV